MSHHKSSTFYKNGHLMRVDGYGRNLVMRRAYHQGGSLNPFENYQALQSFTPAEISGAYNALPKSLQNIFDTSNDSVAKVYKGIGRTSKKESLKTRLLKKTAC
jgi:hypothetical protein